MTKMYSVTCPDDMGEFISDKELSPSSIFQSAIQQIIDTSKISEQFLQEKMKKIEFLQQTIAKQREFIEKENLMDKFIGIA